MKTFLGGVAIAWAVASFSPKILTGIGSGSDDRGDYNYAYVTINSSRFGLQISYWPEKVTA